MQSTQRPPSRLQPIETLDCGIPVDAQYFDDSRFDALPDPGASALLAQVKLPAQYCGVLEYFSQFTDLWSRDPAEVRTPGLRWQILANREPLSPYHQLTTILNPWGFGSFQFSIRLPEGALVELVARRIDGAVNFSGQPINVVGGRLLGRYWYNSAYGGAR